MPWKASEAKSHTKEADTPKKKRQWRAVANSMLASGKSEGAAIRAANAAVGKDAWSEEAREAAAEARKKGAKRKERIASAVQAGLASYRKEHARLAAQGYAGGKAKYKQTVASMNATLRGYARHGFGKTVAPAYGPIDTGGPMPLHMCDTIELDDGAKVTYTRDGVLKAMPRIARTGIQLYQGQECGRIDVDRVRVYRPEDTVFATDAVRSYTNLPITLDHPPEMVTPQNWRKYAVGDTGEDVLRDGGTVRVPMMLRDAQAIEAFKQGTKQLSVGYDCDLDWSPGVTEDGEEYDAVQRNVRANHLAVVAAARGGSSLTIGDDKREDKTMNMKTMIVDGIECQMSDVAASVVKRALDKLDDEYNKLAEAFDEFKKKKKDDDDECEDKMTVANDAVKAKDAELKTKDAEIATLKQQLKDANDPARRAAEHKDWLAVADKVRKMMGAHYKIDENKSINDIRRDVVNAKMGDQAKEWNDSEVAASFKTLTAGTPIADAVRAFNGPTVHMMDERERAYQEVEQRDRDAWKTGKVA